MRKSVGDMRILRKRRAQVPSANSKISGHSWLCYNNRGSAAKLDSGKADRFDERNLRG
jgi:hypothetical protein